jgi:WD40 repeat protein
MSASRLHSAICNRTFSSSWSGPREIWVCDADGANAVQLTHFGGPIAGTPRWSPDGRRIAFDSRPGNNADVYVIDSEGGAPRRLTDHPTEDARPSWSPDGKSIYFSSSRSGRAEIWRMPAAGGEPTQITKDGGFWVSAARDGQWLYYGKNDYSGELRKIRIDGAADTEALPLPVSFLAFTVTSKGAYFIAPSQPGRDYSSLRMQRFETGKITELAKLDYDPGLGLSVSPDERYVLVTKPDQNGTDLMLVENFR